MSFKANKSFSAQQLLDAKAYGGWLQITKAVGASVKMRYCVIHQGEFYLFKCPNSKSAKNVFRLAGYRAQSVQRTGSNNWFLTLTADTGINKAKSYTFSTGSKREQEEWIKLLNDEVLRFWQPAHTIWSPGDKLDHTSDDNDDNEYDYEQTQPIDISFSNPENYDDPSSYRSQMPSSEKTFAQGSFHGPKMAKSNTKQVLPVLPKPPPRIMAEHLPSMTQQRDDHKQFESNLVHNIMMYPMRKPSIECRTTEDSDSDSYEDMNSSEGRDEPCYVPMESVDIDKSGSANASVKLQNQMPRSNIKPIVPPKKLIAPTEKIDTEFLQSNAKFDSPKKLTSSHAMSSLERRSAKEPSIKITLSSGENRPLPNKEPFTINLDDYENPNYLAEHEDSDASILPSTVYQWSLSRDESHKLLSDIAAVGLYLIRKSQEKQNVLSVYVNTESKHYIIFSRENLLFLAPDPEPKFKKIGDLIHHYMKNCLPTCSVKLTRPYR